MKNVMGRGWMIILAFVMVTAMSVTTTEAQSRVSLQVFYDELQPYGTWMDYGSHGYVWIPRVDRGFVPYATNGSWINTEYGNTWASDYSWGWAPFHYGRWLFDDFYGWMWVPDTEWAPAWVAWRSGGGYYGWAPLMPGMGIHTSVHFYNGFPAHYWSFVPYRYVTYRRVYNHCIPRPQVVNIINHTTIITHNHTDQRRHKYFTGPTRNEIEHRGGGRVVVHKINESDRPGRTEVSRSTANFYRPEIDNTRDSRSSAVPSAYVKRDRQGNLEQVKTPRNGSSEVYNFRGKNLDGKDVQTEQRNNGSWTREESSQRREYQSPQRTRTFEDQNNSRTYQRMPQEQQKITRDRFEAPPVERGGANREMRRQNDVPSQQWQPAERQNQVREQRNVQPTYDRNPSVNPTRTRSSVRQPEQPAQIRRSDSGAENRQPSQSTGRQSDIRKRN